MLKYLGCFIIIAAMALIGKLTSIYVGGRIDGLKTNLDTLKKAASDHEFFGVNINCSVQKSKYLKTEDIKLLEEVILIKNIDELNETIQKFEEHFKNIKEKNEWLRNNSIILSVLMGLAIITLLY